MFNTLRFKTAGLFAVSLLTVIGLAACSSSAGPEDRQFDLAIENGAVELESGVVTVSQNDNVTLNFNSDADGRVHLHGYDIEQEVGPGEPTTFAFVADATGRYNFTFHEGGGDHDEHDGGMDMDADAHAALFESSTLETGDTFEFEIPHDLHDASIPFHNHMSHEATGHIMVDEHADAASSVSFNVNGDGSFSPMEVMVQPGTTVMWTNDGPDRARIASGNPPTIPDEHEDGAEHEEEGQQEEENETLLGTLEVRPR